MTTRYNALDPLIDVKGVTTVQNTRVLPTDEASFLGASTSNGTGDSITAPSSGTQTLTDAGATFTNADIGRFITIAGSSGGLNDTTSLVTAVPSGTQITYLAAGSGVLEASFTGTWKVNEPYTIADDINFERTDRKDIKGTVQHYTAVPTYTRPDATGTSVPANLTNIAGKTTDAKAIVRDTLQSGIKLRPPISMVGTNGTGDSFTFSTPVVTLDDSGATFTSDDVGRYITILGATTPGNNGTFVITAVNSGTQLTYNNASGATEAFTGTWTIRDATLAIGDETFVTAGLHFTADDLNSFITISNSTDANGTYRIKTVTDGQTLELDGLSSATAEGCSWALVAGLKGVLSARNWADTTNTTGIPIADSGAYDATNYNATFVEVIDNLDKAGAVTEAALAIWGRSYGDEKDPNNTATNEGTRFFVQLLTGVNDGTATAAALEMISGRSGAVATVAGGNKQIGGLTGIVAEDVGKWITIWDCGTAANCGIYQIATVVSATAVTVTRGSNFTADASTGSIRWAISREGNVWDFYNGDRYRFDQMSDTAFRTTMIGGIQSDAALAQAIYQLQQYSGSGPGLEHPVLSNTGNYYVFSEIPGGASDSNLTEIVQALNDQIGDRNYVGPTLTDGETITDSLRALEAAISSSTIVRTIERLAAAVTKFTVHNMPAGCSYTPDGTNNGRNMFVFWRGLLKDPGTVANGDDYQETSGSGGAGGVGQITPYTTINANDHINYLILQ
jgi:hypothetical protein